MGTLVKWMDRALYADSFNNWDDELLRQRILARIRPHFVILDVGAGAGILPQMNFKGLATRVCGIDLDPRVVENPMLDEAKVADAGAIPYADDSFDLVLADNVLEHIEEPSKFFSEIARVLRPGGLFIFKTPNKWHYVPTIARLTPHWFHQSYNQLRGRALRIRFRPAIKLIRVAMFPGLRPRPDFRLNALIVSKADPSICALRLQRTRSARLTRGLLIRHAFLRDCVLCSFVNCGSRWPVSEPRGDPVKRTPETSMAVIFFLLIVLLSVAFLIERRVVSV